MTDDCKKAFEEWGNTNLPDEAVTLLYETTWQAFQAAWQAARATPAVGDDELTDQQIIDIVAIFNNPTSPKIRCDDCEGKGQLDVEDEDGYLGRCPECEGYGYTHAAVNQTERVKQVREHVLTRALKPQQDGGLVEKLIALGGEDGLFADVLLGDVLAIVRQHTAEQAQPLRERVVGLLDELKALDKATSDFRMKMPVFADRDGRVRICVTLDILNPFMQASADFCTTIGRLEKALSTPGTITTGELKVKGGEVA